MRLAASAASALKQAFRMSSSKFIILFKEGRLAAMAHGTVDALKSWRGANFKLLLEGLVVGLAAGAVTVAFRVAWDYVESWRDDLFKWAAVSSGYRWVVLPVILVLVLVAGYLTETVPEAAGSGIPFVKAYFRRRRKLVWQSLLPAKFVGCLLSVASGLSVGREGPMLQMGAAAGQAVSRMIMRPKIEEPYLVAAGISAGLSAAFNTPLAGMMFVLERVQRNFSPYVFGSTLTASITADLVSQYVFGVQPLFRLTGLSPLPLAALPLPVLLGVLGGLLGAAFNLTLHGTLNLYERFHLLPRWLHPLLPGMAAAALGFVLPDVLGGGHALMRKTLNGTLALGIIPVIFLAKFVFTLFSYGSRVPGGIFLAPLLLGALLGSFFSQAAAVLVPPSLLPQAGAASQAYAMIGLVAFFTAVVRAPITGILLAVEMTAGYENVLALLAASMSAFMVAGALRVKPVYEMLLDRELARSARTGQVAAFPHNHVALSEITVETGSLLANRRLKDVTLPDNCLIVSIRRGMSELLPRGNTRLLGGDIIVVLTPVQASDRVIGDLMEMTGAEHNA